MAKSQLPKIEDLRKFLRYEAETGHLFWLPRSRSEFKSDGDHAGWNKKYAGRRALNCVKSYGYLHGTFLGRNLRAHRAAWAIHYGVWPVGVIDHVNGCVTDNRIENLRDVSDQENTMNCRRSSDNRSGVTGVSWHKRDLKWQAQIQVGGNFQHLGQFSRLEDAVNARKRAERDLGFHPNHGRH